MTESATPEPWDGVERRKRSIWRDYAGTIAGIIAILVATIAIVITIVLTGNVGEETDSLDQRLTPLEQAPCRLNPGSKLCSQSIDGILKTISGKQAALLQAKADHYHAVHGE